MAKLDSNACAVSIDEIVDAYDKFKDVDPEKAAELAQAAFEDGLLKNKKPNVFQKINEFIINGMLSGLALLLLTPSVEAFRRSLSLF